MDGIVIIDKPKGYTSHDVVAKVKRILKAEKIGHTGTLDPNATGVLPLLINKGTRVSKYLIEHDKIYEVTLKLGEKTDTMDAEGTVIEKQDISTKVWNEEKVKEILESFLGKMKQTPPMYSAIKVKGKKLYEYARKGEKVEIPEREIEIYEIALLEIREEEIDFKVHCSKGTYIRSLCEDIAESLETIGYMKELRRTKVGRFFLEDTISIEELERNPEECLKKKGISLEKLWEEEGSISLKEEEITPFINGVKLRKKLEDGIYKIYIGEEFIGIGVLQNEMLKRDVLIKD